MSASLRETNTRTTPICKFHCKKIAELHAWLDPFVIFEHFTAVFVLVSFAAVLWMSRNALPKERGALRDIQKTAAKETIFNFRPFP